MVFNVCYMQKSVQNFAKIFREENIICNQFKHLEKEHSTYLNTLIQDLGDTIFICAVTVIMRFLYNRKEIVSFNVKTRIYRLLKT